jgi:hypothetical protein
MKAITDRYAIATTVFVVSALIIGVPLIGTLECLSAVLLASTITMAFQRRKHVRASRAGLQGTRRSVVPAKPIHENEISGYGWPVRSALE